MAVRFRSSVLFVALLASQCSMVSAQSTGEPDGQMTSSSQQVRVQPQRLFISGHSLLNEPIPSDLAEIAKSLDQKLSWNRQYLEGSSIKQRSRGDGGDESQWTGYTRGLDFRNDPVNVLMEFQKPTRHPGQPYDALLITEQHALLGSLVWSDTVFYLRRFQDRFAQHSPKGVTYFYEPWLSLDNKSNPKRWIEYERSAAPVWDCVVSQLNRTIVADGREDRILRIPAALALAQLIERATADPGIPGITKGDVRATVDSLVRDDVHLTELGAYYMALVTFSVIFERSPEGAWHPAEVTDQQAAALQRMAAEFGAQRQPAAMTLSDCRRYVLTSFLWTFLGYMDAVYWRNEMSYLRALYLRSKLAIQWSLLFLGGSANNPFSEAAYKRR